MFATPATAASEAGPCTSRHRRLRDSQAELQQLAVDPRRTPQRIRAAHLPYQIPQVPPNRGPTPSASTLPCPVEPEARRCHRTTVSGRTTCKELRQFFQSLATTIQKTRSISVSPGRG